MVCLGLSENHPFKGPDSFPSATVKGEACPRLGDGPAMGLDQGSLMWFPVFHASLFSNCFHANRILMLFLMHCDLCSHTELPLEYLFSWASWSKRCSSKRSLGRSENHSWAPDLLRAWVQPRQASSDRPCTNGPRPLRSCNPVSHLQAPSLHPACGKGNFSMCSFGGLPCFGVQNAGCIR